MSKINVSAIKYINILIVNDNIISRSTKSHYMFNKQQLSLQMKKKKRQQNGFRSGGERERENLIELKYSLEYWLFSCDSVLGKRMRIIQT